MGRGKVILYPQVQKKLEDLGHRIKLARLRRKLTIEMVAERAKISRFSVREVEKGSPSVAIGIYVNVLMSIGMVKELDNFLADDPLGRMLQDDELLKYKRKGTG